MKNLSRIIFNLLMILSLVIPGLAWSKAPEDSFSYQPTAKEGKKHRIAYYQGGPANNYFPYLIATVKGLIDLGWINAMQIPMDNGNDTQTLWNWLAQNAQSDYVEFVADAYYTANWDSAARPAIKKTIINRLNTKKDVDLIIAMGTWAGKDLANNEHSIPIMVMSSTDPVAAGIIASNSDSGLDHVFARVDPRRYERQMRIFQDTIGFKTLGIAYEDSALGRSYAAIDLIEKVAEEKNFTVNRCFTKDDIPDRKVAGDSVIKCFEQLSSTVDAIYVVTQSGVNEETIPKLVSIANQYRIPTFSQLGSDEVKHGFLMSIAREGGFAPVGRFLAISMAKIFNGAKPRQLNQVFEEKPAIALNLKTAEIVGLYLSAEILAAADEIYRQIENP